MHTFLSTSTRQQISEVMMQTCWIQDIMYMYVISYFLEPPNIKYCIKVCFIFWCSWQTLQKIVFPSWADQMPISINSWNIFLLLKMIENTLKHLMLTFDVNREKLTSDKGMIKKKKVWLSKHLHQALSFQCKVDNAVI